jgi:hypothetical protein
VVNILAMKFMEILNQLRSPVGAWLEGIPWTTLWIWGGIALGLALMRRAGACKVFAGRPLFWILTTLAVLGAPLIAGVTLWTWGRVGLIQLAKVWAIASGVRFFLDLVADGLIRLRKLDYLKKRSVVEMAIALFIGPLGLTGSMHRLVSGLTPRTGSPGGIAANLGERLAELTGAGSPFAEMDEMMTNAGQQMESEYVALWERPMEMSVVKAEDFPHLDSGWYDGTQAFLARYGFVHVVDLEVVSARMPELERTLVRALISPDRSVSAGIYQVKAIPGVAPLDLREVDFETEFADGSFVCTTTNQAAGNFDHGARVQLHARPGLPLEQVGQQHYEMITSHAAARGTQPVLVQSVKELMDLQSRLHKAKSAARPREGMSRDEFARIAGSSPEAEVIYKSWQKARV